MSRLNETGSNAAAREGRDRRLRTSEGGDMFSLHFGLRTKSHKEVKTISQSAARSLGDTTCVDSLSRPLEDDVHRTLPGLAKINRKRLPLHLHFILSVKPTQLRHTFGISMQTLVRVPLA